MTTELPVKDCIILNYFVDSANPDYHRRRYCNENCKLKCLTGKEYKRRKITEKLNKRI